MDNSICYFIPDTNVFLHYVPFTEINWLKELGVEKAVLLVCYSVISELDKKKFQAQDKKIQERARKVVSKLEEISESNEEFRDNVTLKFITREVKIDWNSEGLNPDVQDDWIIATILCERENYTPLTLVTSDLGLKMKAKSRGIETKKLPDTLLLKAEKDPRQLEIEKLRKQLLEMQNRMPDLQLLLWYDEQYQERLNVCLKKPTQISQEETERRLTEMQEKLVYVPPKETSYSFIPFYGPPPPEEIKRYKEDVDKYIQNLREFFVEKNNYEDIVSRIIEFRFILVNKGNAPAEDVDIFIDFPDGFEMCEEKELPKAPQEPPKPIPPRTQSELLFNAITFPEFRMPNIYTRDLSLPNIEGKPSIKKTNSYEVQYKVIQLKHLMEMKFEPVYAIFPSLEDAKSFHFDILILAANYPEIRDTIHVIIDKEE